MKPEFVDNQNGNTLVEALRGHMDWLRETYKEPVEVSIATGYFNPEGFALIADKIEDIAHVRLMLGAEPTPPPARPIRKPGEPRGERFEAKLVREAIEANFRGLQRDRDHLQFTEETDRSLRKLLEFLDSGKVESRLAFYFNFIIFKANLVTPFYLQFLQIETTSCEIKQNSKLY